MEGVTEQHFYDCPHDCIGRRSAKTTLLATVQSTPENDKTNLIIWASEVNLYLIICSFEESDDSTAESMCYNTSFLITQE